MRVGAKMGIAEQASGRSRKRRLLATARPVLCALLGAVLVLALFAAPASAKKTHLFLETFGPAAQPTFKHTLNLTVDYSNGDLLVVDPAPENTISRFKPNGEPDPFPALGTNVIDAKKGPGNKACGEEAASCDQTPQNGFGFGTFPAEQQIAVDNSGTLTDGDIYVSEFERYVSVFAADGHYLGQITAAGATNFSSLGICGVAVDPGGNVFLAEYLPPVEVKPGVFERKSRIHKFDPSANPPLNSDHVATASVPEDVCSLAAGAGPSAGYLFAGSRASVENFSNGEGEGVFRLSAASDALEGGITPVGRVALSLSIDPASGHLFTSDGRELTSSGALVSTFESEGSPVAADGARGRVYASGSQAETVKVFGPLVTLPDVATGGYQITGDTSARIKGTVNPDGEAVTECSFEYGLTAAYGQSAPCEAPSAAEVGSGSGPVEVHADLTGLGGETAYHYRLVARNANAALYPKDNTTTVRGLDQIFKTPSKPGIKELWAQDVITANATLKATVNPENSPTTYRFEWGLDSSYGSSSAEFGLGSDGADHVVKFQLSGLEPASTYHYRLVASNGIGASEGADHRFTTFAPQAESEPCPNDAFRIGFGSLLPDCRAYEMVSPLDKEGGDIQSLFVPPGVFLAALEQASLSGEKLAYGTNRSFGGAASAPRTSQYIAQRIGGEEWRTHPINSVRGRPTQLVSERLFSEFKAFSDDLCDAWQITTADPPLAEGGLTGYPNLYRRSDELCSEDGAAHYEALAPLAAPEGAETGPDLGLDVWGFSADGRWTIFTANAKLEPNGIKGKRQLYVTTTAGPRLVCILPDQAPLRQDCTAGSPFEPSIPATGTLTNVISADGSSVFWASAGRLYLRRNPAQPESARLHGAASGEGDLIGPAAGTGNLVAGSEVLKNVKATSGVFAVGQGISSGNGGIPANTTIAKVEEKAPGTFELTLSAKVSTGKTKVGDTLTGLASEKATGVVTETGAFQAGQEISAPAIPPGTTVTSCAPACGPSATTLTLSAKATKTETGAKLSATSPCTEAETKACTVPVSQAAEEAEGRSGSHFWDAAADGSKAIFTIGALGNAALYSFDADSESTTKLAEGVEGVMGISEDASRVYFASRNVLSGEANSNGDTAQAGKPNLYLREAGGGIEFIGTLAAADVQSGLSSVVSPEANFHLSRVSADGLHAAFRSLAPLTGYDNIGATADATGCGGGRCPEVYRYDANADELLCISCNPSGARPHGRSSIPGWEENGMHAARVLPGDGSRLYFESADALTPRDTNGAVDVYQWEAPGSGSCEESSPTFSARNGGCVDLVSSGQSKLDSRFVEATPSGEDVFIATAASLLPQDPGVFDIYDARANGGLPLPTGPAPACEGEACQGVVEAPDDPTPASLSFEGAGNVREGGTPPRKPCAKGKVRRHGKCVARKHAKKHRRAKRKRRAAR